jgi:hypothetical protein
MMKRLVEGEDYYLEGELYVFTGKYLLGRGYCCGSRCRHCPYPQEVQAEAVRRRLEGRPIKSRAEFVSVLKPPIKPVKQ